jgi:starch-binding outer membrane protein, SusD/RagB family
MMNKKIKTLWIALLVLILVPLACNDEFLDLQPHSSISTDMAFETMDDFEAALNGVYSAIRSGAYYGKNMMLYGDFMSDNLYARIGYSNSYGIIYQFEHTAGTSEIISLWQAGYTVAVRATHIIDKIDNLDEGTQQRRDQIKGEAYLARALAHFDLVRYYAPSYQRSNPLTDLGVPYRVEISLNPIDRETLARTYELIINDLSMAYDLINEPVTLNFRFSKDVADALFARIYHEMGDWEKAIEHATKLITNPRYQLLSGAAYRNMWTNDEGAEIIFKIGITQAEAPGMPRIGSNFIGANPPSPLWNVDYLPALDLMFLFDDKDDIRFETYFRRNTGTPQTGIQTVITKYPTNPAFVAYRGTNMPKVFRLAEMYLIRAEAYASQNRDAEAMADLNALRRARIDGWVDVNLTGETLKREIANERRVELAFEGHRFLDLKRRGEGFQRVPQPGTLVANNLVVEPDYFRFVWPIPEPEMLANPLLKDKQNPGY